MAAPSPAKQGTTEEFTLLLQMCKLSACVFHTQNTAILMNRFVLVPTTKKDKNDNHTRTDNLLKIVKASHVGNEGIKKGEVY